MKVWAVVSGGNEEDIVVTFHKTHPEAFAAFKQILDDDLEFADKSKFRDDADRTYQQCLNDENYIIDRDGTYFEVIIAEGSL